LNSFATQNYFATKRTPGENIPGINLNRYVGKMRRFREMIGNIGLIKKHFKT
jgi:hypothetical protein